jgi:hypothetical protein
LRYYVPLDAREEHLAELITTCERIGVTDVSLFITEYLGISQFKEIGDPRQLYQQAWVLSDLGLIAFSAECRLKSRNETTPFECVKDGKSALQ